MTEKPRVYRMLLRPYGLFSQIANVVDMLNIAEREGFQFRPEWEECLYADHRNPGSIWNYWFEPLYPELNDAELQQAPFYAYQPLRKDHLISPSLEDGMFEPTFPPHDRLHAEQLIQQHVQLKPGVQEKIESFKAQYFSPYTIGLHLRGPGRLHGGTGFFKRAFSLEDGVPYQAYFKAVDHLLEGEPEARIFLATDSQDVVRRCEAQYGEKLITTPSLRSDFGELHIQARNPKLKDFPGYQMGEDVIMDAWLLASTRAFVHGNSNVSNFVLCLNAGLPHHDIYAGIHIPNWVWRIKHYVFKMKTYLRPLKQRFRQVLRSLD